MADVLISIRPEWVKKILAGEKTVELRRSIILKLTHVIDWSWWWVLSPFWIPLGIWLIVLAVSLPAIIKRRKRRKELEKWKFR